MINIHNLKDHIASLVLRFVEFIRHLPTNQNHFILEALTGQKKEVMKARILSQIYRKEMARKRKKGESGFKIC